MTDTSRQYQEVINSCRNLFEKKGRDYGTAWRILRLPSLTDQIFIKAQRLRTIENKGTQKVADHLEGEYAGIINYSLMALIQIEKGVANEPDIDIDEALLLYDKMSKHCYQLMLNKNHDYGEAWREMRLTSLTDLILQKLLRIKQIENNSGTTLVSEGIDANYSDMVNYSIFALIKLNWK
jgi:hypothetical protein